MKLKDYLGAVIRNKSNGQLNVSLKKNKLKRDGISKEELFNMDIDFKLKKLLLEDE